MRKNWRGFNQTEIIGKSISMHFGWRYIDNYLERVKISPPQTGLIGKRRKKNIKGVFSLNRRSIGNEVFDSIILFDDVWTTGSILREAARVLKVENKLDVWLLTLSRRV